MTYEELIILDFLKAYPKTAFARREIARKAVKRRVFEENPQWADQPLQTLVARGLVIIDQSGFYKIKKSEF